MKAHHVRIQREEERRKGREQSSSHIEMFSLQLDWLFFFPVASICQSFA